MPISTLETRSRISSFQSHASRRDREFLPFGLMLRDEIEKFVGVVGSMNSCLRMISISIISKTSSLVKIVFLNFCFHFCQNATFQQDTVWGGWKWKWLLKVWSKLWFRLLRFPAKSFKPVYTDIESLNTPTWQSKFKPVSNHLHSDWEKGRRNLATGSINALQTTPTN